MKTSLRIIGAAGVLAALATLPAIAANVDVGVNIGIPGVYAAPQTVYVAPRPVYVQPQPVYVQPRPVYIEQEAAYPDYRKEKHHKHHGHHRDDDD
jgi:hypothetical protein